MSKFKKDKDMSQSYIDISQLFLNSGVGFEKVQELIDEIKPYFDSWWKNPNPNPSNEGEILYKGFQKEESENVLDNSTNDPIETLKVFMKRYGDQPRFNENSFVNVHPQPPIVSVVSSLVALLGNSNQIVKEVSPSLYFMEEEIVEYLARNIGFETVVKKVDDDKHFSLSSKGALGNIVSGGTIANQTGLLIARNRLYMDQEINIIENGYPGDSKKGFVISTENSHYSLEKAVIQAGLGKNSLKKVSVHFEYGDYINNFRPKRDSLAETLEDLEESQNNGEGTRIIAMVPTLGTTETGIIEDLDMFLEFSRKFNSGFSGKFVKEFEEGFKSEAELKDLEELKRRTGNIYVHADAAVGGAYFMVDSLKNKLKNLKEADSITLDPHKMFYMGYPTGMFLIKNGRELVFNTTGVSYINLEVGHGASTIEGSRSSLGVSQFWSMLKTVGLNGYNQLHENALGLTKELFKMVDDSNYLEPLHTPDLVSLSFLLKDPKIEDLSKEEVMRARNGLIEKHESAILAEESVLLNISSQKSGGIAGTNVGAVRAVVMNPHTTYSNLENIISALEKIVKEGK